MRIRNTEEISQVKPTLKDCLENLDCQLKLLKLLLLCASSTVSMAIALTVSPVYAEGQSSRLRATTLSELKSPLASDPSIQNSTIANFDEVTVNKKLHHTPIEGSFAASEKPVHPPQHLKRANALFVGPAIENTVSIQSIESVSPRNISLNGIAQGDNLELSDSVIESTEIQPTEPALASDLMAQDEPTSPPSAAQSSSEPTDRWQFSVEPYFFVPFDVQADVTVDGRRTSVDLGLDDILNLDRAFDAGLRLEARHDRWGFSLDGFYIFASDSGSLGRSFSAGSLLQFVRQTDPENIQQFVQRFEPEQIQQIVQVGQQFGLDTPVRVTADGRVSVRQITIDAAVSYRIVDTSLDNSPEETDFYPRLVIAPIVGVRTNFLRQTVEVDTVRIDDIPIANDRLPAIDREFRFSRTLVEPLIGAQFELALSERWALGFRGDVSGFNIGADRNVTWNLLAGAQYRLSRLVSLHLAYRFNSFDFEDGEGLRRTRLELDQDGLWLSAIFRF